MSPDDADDSPDSDTEEGADDAPLDQDDWVEFDDDTGSDVGSAATESDDEGEATAEGPDTGGGQATAEPAQEAAVETAPAGTKYCHNCGTTLDVAANFCSECGTEQAGASVAAGRTTDSPKDRVTAGVLAILLGGLGAHHFYLGNVGLGVVYLCFFWTGIPAVVGLVEGILYLTKTDAEFQEQYVDLDDEESADSATAAGADADGGGSLGDAGDGGGE
jgi:TM2 domain-containing membrane protein YozV